MATQLAPANENLPALSPEGERFALRQRQARMFAMSPLVPEHLRKGPPEQALANCYIALTLAEAMGEVPLIVMQNIHVVNGKAGFAAQYMIARANASGIFRGRIDWRIDRSDAKNLSVTAYAVLKETGQEVSLTVDMAMATAEAWTKNPKYRTMPEVMLRYRSATFLVRFYAPDVMLGYQASEEIEDVGFASGPDLNASPLSAAMLIEQAATVTEPDPEQHDPDTGEIATDARGMTETDEETARQLDTGATGDFEKDFGLAEAATDDASVDTADLPDPHRGKPYAERRREVLDMIAAAENPVDLKPAIALAIKHAKLFTQEVKDELNAAAAEAQARFAPAEPEPEPEPETEQEAAPAEEDQTPARAQTITELRGGIRNAKNLQYLAVVDDKYVKARAGLPDEIVAELDGAIDAKRKALREAGK